jgi:hypothetical protein
MVERRHQHKHHLANKEILYQKHKSYLASKSNQHDEYSDDYGPNNDGDTVVTITHNVDVYCPVDNNRDSVSKGYNNNGGDDYVENRHTAGEYGDVKTRTKAVVNKGYDDDDDYP